MFFTLSKIAELFLSPFLWLGLLVTLAFFVRKKEWSRRLLGAAVALFFLAGNRFVADEFMRAWEYPVTAETGLDSVYDVGILLGGGMVQIDKESNRLVFRHNTDRFLQVIDLYRKNKIRKILLSGGSGDLRKRDQKESPLLMQYLIGLGVPRCDIIIDSVSDNTHENAVISASLLKGHSAGNRYLLVTSAFHMRRAMACFRKQGLSCDPFTTNKNTGPRVYTIEHLLLPDVRGFLMLHSLIHEVLGYAVYKTLGYA